MPTATLSTSSEVSDAVAAPGQTEPLSLLSYTSAHAASLTDDELIDAQRSVAHQRRLLDASAAVLAAETQHRSRRELGHAGLAQRWGARSAEVLIQHVTGVSGVDARSLVRVGTLVTDLTSSPSSAGPVASGDPALDHGESESAWLSSVAEAVSAGGLSVAAAEAIRVGLGIPNEQVTTEALAGAAASLVHDAGGVTLERLAAIARARRDALDEAGIALREEERRQRRYLHLIPQADGMIRITGLLDPESAAIVTGAIDAITAPRRGGPRFVDPKQAARAAAIEADPRTTPQLALDGLVELVRVATLADRGRVLGAKRVGVRVHVAERDLRRGAGAGHIEGQTDAVSIATAQRIACDNGVLPIAISFDGQPLDVGRTQRTFTPRQRIALAARDGGCIIAGCNRPPEWCEAHHIDEWMRDHGSTNLADGVLLCRQHHMMLHNHGYKITRNRTEYFLIQPEDSTDRTPIPLSPNPPIRLPATG